ncbi:MAG: serine/threonine-protein kinase PknK [Oscillochloris sp.]|nr:serine/threonine-protein kinase PknK [Oscillochloris sp.]
MSLSNLPTIDGYVIHALIAEGGFGTVYHATQHLAPFSREVAIKVVRQAYASSPAFIRRFEVEAQTIAALEHPHIVPLYDYWRDTTGAYLVMRWMAGGSLTVRMATGRLPLNTTLDLAGQIASALALAHRRGVIHQDIKPANVLLDAEGNAYLADFGIACQIGMPVKADTNFVPAFTPGYAAPEQIRTGEKSPQSDIYSFGVLLYELLSGTRAFHGLTPTERIRRQLAGPLPQLAPRFPDISGAVDAVIRKATEAQPEHRYLSVIELMSDLAATVGHTPFAGATFHPRTGEFSDPGATLLFDLDDTDTPYKGLRAFQEADTADFFGREMLAQRLVARLSGISDETLSSGSQINLYASTLPIRTAFTRFLIVVGPSGCGKSSAVRAGLLPALRRGSVLGAQHWFIAEMLPGPHPLEALASALERVAATAPPNLLDLLQSSPDGLRQAVDLVLPADPTAELLLLIDQLEELFTLVESEAHCAFLLRSLHQTLIAPDSRLRVVATLRADFYDRPMRYPGFAELLGQGTELVLPLSPTEVERAIVGPAERVGAIVEPELVATMVADVGAQPGALPLLQYALTELFARREGRMLTLAVYESSGGVRGALARKAEELYTGLDVDMQAAARQIFLRLVTLGAGTEDTRRRARLAELDMGIASRVVLDRFGTARLLTFDRDGQTREPTVELAHEALLRVWDRLQAWVCLAREDLFARQRLDAAVAEWEASGRESSFLAQGGRLTQFAGLASSALVLNTNEQAFLEASLKERRRTADHEQQRQQREQEQARNLAQTKRWQVAVQASIRRRLRLRVILLVLVALVALFAAGTTAFSSFSAQENVHLIESECAVVASERQQPEQMMAVAQSERGRADDQSRRTILLVLVALVAIGAAGLTIFWSLSVQQGADMPDLEAVPSECERQQVD